ncbi:MAG: ATP-dependent DNA helicase [Duncaniella sp.]|nr:ATP-dependent DNA helicase [Duncaniella sp.]
MTKHEVLRKYWGYDDFRPRQAEIIDSVLAGRDTLGLLPTGGGKSLTFQVPALMLPGLTVVVTPLISLMKDQVDNLAARGIRAALFHSGMTPRERELSMTRCRLGKAKIAYVSPERLQNEMFLTELRTLQVSLLVVDEAHCISQWGYDFRPSYLRLRRLRQLIGEQVPVLALTASATPEVTADIMDRLGFRAPNVLARSFRRDNLSYIVRYSDNKEEMLLRVLRATSGSSIVYVRSRRRTLELSRLLDQSGIPALAYHAGLDSRDKDERQDLWKAGSVRVMVATNAFGMGIDKPDVRLVIHFDLPSSLEEYYQEAGRGGRDGLESLAVIIANARDKATLARRVAESFPSKEFLAHVYEMAGNYLEVAVGSGYGHTYEFNFSEFCDRFHLPPPATDSALRLLSRSRYLDYV